MKIKYKNNFYKYSNNTWYIKGGFHGRYLSKVTDVNVLTELNKLLDKGNISEYKRE